MNDQLILLPPEEFDLRTDRLTDIMAQAGVPAIIVTDNANLYYLTGRVFAGYIYLNADGTKHFFVRRPTGLTGENLTYIRKPEQMAEVLGVKPADQIGFELDITSYSTIARLSAIFPESAVVNASPLLQKARSVKTPFEVEKIRKSGIKQEHVYRMIPHLYKPDMSDLELQVEIERASRLEGCLGQFRISGNSMELYMANILAGENADTPTPYDFAMGGEGLDPSLPVGCNGTLIREGMSVMVDVNGNYTGYMTDMTRTFAVRSLSDLAMKAHQCSIDICNRLAAMALPGVEAKVLFHEAESMARAAGLYDYFMGHHQKAGFVGHGLGIEINELPVIAPRSRDILTEGNVIAIEPKFVIPEVGAVGIENTYLIKVSGAECLTNAPQQIIYFE
ncbi:MAG: Xaa-Pro peptidase family protein [Bacteroides sp.]|nr:Xaa-Pro peptidase family protein [Bacteroides sp.]MCM1412845.1 Xaa-Pro peptidase family protein [Bacteroides sp.]MCM1471514.1 Xaa-Pro peptidase family protein [Bacteroides sp.]